MAASSLSLIRRATASAPLFFNKLLNTTTTRTASVYPLSTRSFNTDTSQVTNYDAGDRSVDVDRGGSDRSVARRRDVSPNLFSDVFDPFSPTRSLSQVLNLMDQFIDPFITTSRGIGVGATPRRGWDVREDNEALYLRFEMPGVDKDQVKVCVEQNTLVIKGEAEKESDDEEYGRRYSSRIDLPPNLYKIDEIKAELKNGVLKVRVPKVKEEERKDVYEVRIE